MDSQRKRLMRLAVTGAVVVGVAAGSYAVASAATGLGSSSGSSLGTTGRPVMSAPRPQPWGAQRSDETLLTGETASKVQAAATAKVTGATVVRVETDADGHAAYEVHMVKSDGTPVTVDVVSVQTGMPSPPQQQPQA
jgi:hypothetical protein